MSWRPTPERVAARAITLLAAGLVLCPAATAASAPFQAQIVDPQPVLAAIAAARPIDLGGAAVTGLVLPHHRVASDLIASGMVTAAQGPRPERIVMLTPDHFKRSPRAFATTVRDFDTAFGVVPVDRVAARTLLASSEVASSILFEREHGIGELLPYVGRLFPGVPVLPVAISIRSTRAQWDRLVDRLAPLVTARTLIVQSTDFSHYLSREQAARRDQQMLNVIAAGDLAALARARQPAHIDSRGGQYIQMRLQQRVFGARPIVYGNRNSADHGATAADNTTSYVAQVYAPGAAARVVFPPGEARTVCLAGDTFFGRHVAAWLARPAVRERLREQVRTRLRGCPLVVNLEGVLSADGRAAHPLQLAMPRADTVQWLQELGVVAVGVANNHSHDLGEDAYRDSVAQLRGGGLQVLESGQGQRVGPLWLTALSDLDNNPAPRRDLLVPRRIGRLSPPHGDAGPALAFVHWGREYVAQPGPRERALAAALRAAGADLVVGAHPHRASAGAALLGGLDALVVHSLGNFIFDQRGPRVSGAVLQLSVFAQGTWAARLLPWPELPLAATP